MSDHERFAQVLIFLPKMSDLLRKPESEFPALSIPHIEEGQVSLYNTV